jgi:hypothetical protein
MSDARICVKTPKGIEEINCRSHGLQQRARRLLIMVDGKRSLEGIAALFPTEDVRPILDQMLADGFVVPLEVSAPQTKVAPPIDDTKRFDMARNFMVNTVNAFVGIAGSSLIGHLENCISLEELRPHYEAWREAILLSSDGRKQIGDLESRLAALLS